MLDLDGSPSEGRIYYLAVSPPPQYTEDQTLQNCPSGSHFRSHIARLEARPTGALPLTSLGQRGSYQIKQSCKVTITSCIGKDYLRIH